MQLPAFNSSSKYLLSGIYFSLHQRKTVYKYKRKPIIKKIETELNFHLPLILISKNPIFSWRVKIPLNFNNFSEQLLIFLSFMSTFSESNQTAISQRCEPN